MPNPDLKLVKENLSKQSSEKLLDILAFSQDDYHPSVIPVIENILTERGENKENIEAKKESFRVILKETVPDYRTQRSIPKIPKFVYWVISILALGLGSYISTEIRKGMFNNLVQSTSQDSVIVKSWTPNDRIIIRDALLKSSFVAKMQEKYKVPFCDCYTKSLERHFPHGMIGDSIPQKVKDTLITECAKQIKSTIE